MIEPVRLAHRPSRPASSAALEIATRTADPAILAAAAQALMAQSQYAGLLPWRASSLAQGHAGVALLCSEFDRRQPGQGWDRAGHQQLEQAVARLGRWDPSLFSGVAGAGMAALLLARGRPRYARLLTRVDDAVAEAVRHRAARLGAGNGCAAADLDLITGLTGLGVYLLTRHQATGSAPGLDVTLATLAGLLRDTGHPRAWHTPGDLATGTLRTAYPGGHHNCGLAHGVPGPLSLLSLATLAGVVEPSAPEAISVAAQWLAGNQCGTAESPDWPDAVPLAGPEPGSGPACGAGDRFGRAAWCYGGPGVARSLWLAGRATGDDRWSSLAARTIRAIAGRPPETWGLSTPGFCHGSAGLLRILQRFAADLDDSSVAAAAHRLGADLAGTFDAGSLLGVRAVEPGDRLVDHPGLLDGAPGVALALLGLDESPGVPGVGAVPVWDRVFLLS